MTQSIGACPIWGSEFSAELGLRSQTNTVYVLDSPRAGGGYQIDHILLVAQVPSMSDKEKARLTTWLVDQRLLGNQHPHVTKEIIWLAMNKRPLHVHERAERLLKFIASLAKTVAGGVEIAEGSHEFHYAYAWSESTEWDEVIYFINYLEEMGWIQNVYTTISGHHLMRVTVAGYSQIAEQETNVDSSQAFIAMWFDPQMNEACDNGIMPAVEDAGYKPSKDRPQTRRQQD